MGPLRRGRVAVVEQLGCVDERKGGKVGETRLEVEGRLRFARNDDDGLETATWNLLLLLAWTRLL